MRRKTLIKHLARWSWILLLGVAFTVGHPAGCATVSGYVDSGPDSPAQLTGHPPVSTCVIPC